METLFIEQFLSPILVTTVVCDTTVGDDNDDYTVNEGGGVDRS